jgi:hypothetical protein
MTSRKILLHLLSSFDIALSKREKLENSATIGVCDVIRHLPNCGYLENKAYIYLIYQCPITDGIFGFPASKKGKCIVEPYPILSALALPRGIKAHAVG